jgi:hypothetical protein
MFLVDEGILNDSWKLPPYNSFQLRAREFANILSIIPFYLEIYYIKVSQGAREAK